MPPAATVPPAPAAGTPPSTDDAPGSRAASFILPGHCIPGTDKELDYVSLAKSADVVKAFPTLGWVDSSATSRR